MSAEPQPGGLDGRPQLRLLGQHERGPVAPFQPQLIPDHERARLGRCHLPRNQPEDRLAGGPLGTLAGDHTQRLLPHGEAVADCQHLVLVVVAPKQPVLQGLDRLHDRLGIGGGLPPLRPHELERGRRGTGDWQRGEVGPQIGKRLPQFRICDVREFERHPVGITRVGIGDAARNGHLGIDRTGPGDRHGAIVSRMHEERPRGQFRPDRQILGGGVHEDRGFGTDAPRLHFGPPPIRVAFVGEKHRALRRFQKAPAGLVLVLPRVALQEIGHQIGHAPCALFAARLADRPFDERAVGPVAFVREHRQEEQLATSNRDFLLEGNRTVVIDFRLRQHEFRLRPVGIDLLPAGLEGRLSPLPLGFDLGNLLQPLHRPGSVFRRRSRRAGKPRPERGQIRHIQLLLGRDRGDRGRPAAREPVAVAEHRRQVPLERRLAGRT